MSNYEEQIMTKEFKIWRWWLVLAAAVFVAGCEQMAGPGTGTTPASVPEDDIEDNIEEGETPPAITGITLLSLPDITIYGRNATFDPAGLVVAYTWNNGNTTEIAEEQYGLTEPDMAKYSPQIITVSVMEYKTVFSINVMDSAKILESVSVSGPANKVNRFGSGFDRTGLAVTGHYSNGTSGDVTNYVTIAGYNQLKRGAQDVTVRVNGKTAPVPGITVRLPADMEVTLTVYTLSTSSYIDGYRRVYLKGESMDITRANFHAQAVTTGGSIPLNYDNGRLLDSDSVSGFNPDAVGKQRAVLHMDEATVGFDVSVIDVKPEVWFDYGYRRTPDDPAGKGPGEGKYYARAGETIVLSPVRFLVGYDRDHKDTGVSYSWSVSGGSYTTSSNGEFCHFTAPAAGTSTATVTVTGNNYITGQPVQKTATTTVVCYAPPGQESPPVAGAGKHNMVYLHHGPGQYAAGGSGYGWSLGSWGGYEVWRVNHQAVYNIRGNPFSNWNEPGVIWVQEDRNGNGITDEMWYELKGSEDYVPQAQRRLNRRYAVTWIDAHGSEDVRGSRRIYWADAWGRAGMWGSAWNPQWPERFTFTGTLIGDPGGRIPKGGYGNGYWGYVDVCDPSGKGHGPTGDIHPFDEFPIHRAVKADGSSVTLTNVRFIKVQTAVFCNDRVFGDLSTEIYSADYLGTQTDFPLPENS
jgi:hypothetical protein